MTQSLDALLRESPVRELIRRDPLLVDAATPIADVIRTMQQEKYGCAVVTRGTEGPVCGIFTERNNVSRGLGRDVALADPIEKVMTPDPESLTLDTPAQKAVAIMVRHGYRFLVLTDEDGKPTGLLSSQAVIRFLAEHFPAEVMNLPPRHDQVMTSPEGG